MLAIAFDQIEVAGPVQQPRGLVAVADLLQLLLDPFEIVAGHDRGG